MSFWFWAAASLGLCVVCCCALVASTLASHSRLLSLLSFSFSLSVCLSFLFSALSCLSLFISSPVLRFYVSTPHFMWKSGFAWEETAAFPSLGHSLLHCAGLVMLCKQAALMPYFLSSMRCNTHCTCITTDLYIGEANFFLQCCNSHNSFDEWGEMNVSMIFSFLEIPTKQNEKEEQRL